MSLLKFQNRFSNEQICIQYLIKMRWPKEFDCPFCPSKKADLIQTRSVFECRGCKKQTSVTAQTMFHKSRIPLRKWFWAIFLVSTSKKGMPMLYLQKQLGIKSYRAAWLMGHKIRQAMTQRDEPYSLEGTVQADQIFIGGQQPTEKRRYASNKTSFLIAVEEDKSKPRFVSFQELETIYDKYLIPALKKKIKKGAVLKTDGDDGFINVCKDGYYKHERSVYSTHKKETQEHLKWVNIVTSNLKRFLLSTYHGVKPKYSRAYLAEFAYRFNRRYWPRQAFDRLLYACLNAKPVTLPELKA